MRTALNAIVKCIFSIGFITVHFCSKNLFGVSNSAPTNDIETATINDDGSVEEDLKNFDPKVSLLGPLPHYSANDRNSKHKSN